MSFVPPYRYITANSLASTLLKQQSSSSSSSNAAQSAIPRKDIAIIDVRDDDYEGGNIIGARNVPSTTFTDHVEKLATSELSQVPTVIFHCSLSQQRGPKSARIYSEARQAALGAGKLQPINGPSSSTTSAADSNIASATKLEGVDQLGEHGGQTILVLRDGFANFGKIYKDDSRLVENYDEESWAFR